MAKSIRSRRHRALLSVLIACRRDVGLTQQQAADRMKWTQSKVAQIETGQRQVYASELFELAAAYKVDPVELFRRWKDW
jgi:transcriptional regulator with XRE-family HTH domain